MREVWYVHGNEGRPLNGSKGERERAALEEVGKDGTTGFSQSFILDPSVYKLQAHYLKNYLCNFLPNDSPAQTSQSIHAHDRTNPFGCLISISNSGHSKLNSLYSPI